MVGGAFEQRDGAFTQGFLVTRQVEVHGGAVYGYP